MPTFKHRRDAVEGNLNSKLAIYILVLCQTGSLITVSKSRYFIPFTLINLRWVYASKLLQWQVHLSYQLLTIPCSLGVAAQNNTTSGRMTYCIIFLICGSHGLLHSGPESDRSSPVVVPGTYGVIYPDGLQLPSCCQMHFSFWLWNILFCLL